MRAAIYERIERSYQLRRDEIPGKLETFHNALQDLPGKGSTFTVALPIKPSPEMKKK